MSAPEVIGGKMALRGAVYLSGLATGSPGGANTRYFCQRSHT